MEHPMNLVVVFRKPVASVARSAETKRSPRKRARKTAVVRYLNTPVFTAAR